MLPLGGMRDYADTYVCVLYVHGHLLVCVRFLTPRQITKLVCVMNDTVNIEPGQNSPLRTVHV